MCEQEFVKNNVKVARSLRKFGQGSGMAASRDPTRGGADWQGREQPKPRGK